MSKYNFGKRLRCWTCKANGDDRFFDGRAKLQLHERTMHAERQQKDNRKRTSSLYCSYGSRISAPEYSSTIGSKLLENVTVCKTGAPKKVIYDEMDKSEIELEIDEKVAETSPRICSHRNEALQENDVEVRNFERESFNLRMRQILSEVDAKKSMIKKLKEDLDKAEMKIIESQGRESRLENQLDIAKREVRKMRNELVQVPEIAENERKQRNQLQREFENEINSQKEQINKVKEELEKERSAKTKKEDQSKLIMDMERKFRRLEKELELEKRLKLEAKGDRDERQKEVDELLNDNEHFRRRLNQYQCEIEKMQDEYKELMEEIHESSNINSETLEVRLAEAEASFERRLNSERAKSVKDIEDCQKQCELLESKCQNSEEKLYEVMHELREVKDELSNAESYRQGDIDRLLEEKESLKAELKAKKGSLQLLESSNNELACKLSDRDRQIRQLEKMKYLFQNNADKMQAYSVLENKFKGTCKLVEQLEINMKNLELASQEKINKECQRKNEEKIELDNELLRLKSKLQKFEEEKLWTQKELHELRFKNADLTQRLENFKQDKHELQVSLSENITLNRSFTETIAEIDAKITVKEEEVIKLKEKNRRLTNDLLEQKSYDRNEISEVREAFHKYRTEVESNLRNVMDLEAAFEDERQIMREKEVEFTKNLKHLQEKLKEKDKALIETEIEKHKLAEKNEQLEEVKSNLQEVGQKLMVAEESLKLKKDECEDLKTRKQDLLAQIKEKERRCEQFEKKLEGAEDHLKKCEEEIQNLSRVTTQLRRENKILKEDIDEACALNNEKDNEVVFLKKKIEHNEELLQIIKQKDSELVAKNDYMQETDKQKHKLAAEVEKMEKIIRELKSYAELLEGDIEVVKEEKEAVEKELDQNKEELTNLRRSEKLMLEKYAKTTVDPLNAKISALEDNLKLKGDELREVEHENMKLTENITVLEKAIKEKENMLLEAKETDAKLAMTSKQLDIAESNLQNLGQCLQDFESSCNKLKTDLKFKRDECEDFTAKQNELLRKIHEKERKCEEFERMLNEVEYRCRVDNEDAQEPDLSKVSGLQDMQIVALEELQNARDKLEQLTRDMQVMEKENEELKMKLEDSQIAQRIAMNYENSEEIRKMRDDLENMKQHKKITQDNNYELKKRLGEEEAKRISLEEQIHRLNCKLEEYRSAIFNGSENDQMQKEAGNWEQNVDDIGETLADIEYNKPTSLEYASKNRTDLTKESKDTSEELKRNNFSNIDKATEMDMMENMDCKLVIEVRDSEEVIRELERKVDLLESDLEWINEEKRIIQEELERKNKLMETVDFNEEDLMKIFQKLAVLENDNNTLEAKCKELNKVIDELEKRRKVDNRSRESLCEISASECNYELRGNEDEKNGKRAHSNHKDEMTKSNNEESVIFSEDDFIDMLDDVKPKGGAETIAKNEEFFIDDDDDDFPHGDMGVKEMAAFEYGYFGDSEIDAKSNDKSQLLDEGGSFKSSSVDEDEEDILDEFVSKQKKHKSSRLPVLAKISGKLPAHHGRNKSYRTENYQNGMLSNRMESGSVYHHRDSVDDDFEADKSHDKEAEVSSTDGDFIL